MGFLKFIVGLLLVILGGFMFSHGFAVLNPSVTDFFFGMGILIIIAGFAIWAI